MSLMPLLVPKSVDTYVPKNRFTTETYIFGPNKNDRPQDTTISTACHTKNDICI